MVLLPFTSSVTLSKSPILPELPFRKEVSQPWQAMILRHRARSTGPLHKHEKGSQAQGYAQGVCGHVTEPSTALTQQKACFQCLAFPLDICSPLLATSFAPKGLFGCPGKRTLPPTLFHAKEAQDLP